MKTQSYNNFWQQIHASAKHRGIPLRVMFELTYRCNFKCRHCYVPESYKNHGELGTKEVFSVLEQLKEAGCFYLGFTGGEPFLRKDIFEILWHAKKCGFEIIIYTNGSLIDDNIAMELGRLRPNKVDITIPGMSKEAFEGVTGITGSRDKVFNAIDLLHKNRVELGFKTCLLKENENEIEEIEKFSASLGALHRLDNMLLPRLDGDRDPYLYRGRLRLPEAAREYEDPVPQEEIYPEASKGQPKGAEELFKCGVGRSQVAITPLGELKMCLMIDYPRYKILNSDEGTVKAEGRGLNSAWERLKDLVTSINPDENYKCNTCELRPYCKWCPAKSWLMNRTFTSCDLESRHRAKQFKRGAESIKNV